MELLAVYRGSKHRERMKKILTTLILATAILIKDARAGTPVAEADDTCPCTTTETDMHDLLLGVDSFDLTAAGQTPVLEVSGDAFSVIEGDDGPVFAASRYGCGKVVVSASQEAIKSFGLDGNQVFSNILKWLASAGGKTIGILSLRNEFRTALMASFNGSCFTIMSVTSRTDLEPYDILVAQTRTDFRESIDQAIIAAVEAGKSLFLLTRPSRNNNDLSGTFGITITEMLTDVNATVTPPELPDPSECITTEVDFGDFEPGKIESTADNGFVPQEGIGASYYGTGRVLVVGNQALFQRGSTFRDNTDFITEALSWVQDCNNCSCEVGYMMRGTPFVRMSKYLEQIDKDVPAVEITPDEMCTTCCVGINLGVVRGDNVDAEAVQEYVYNGGCLILTCPNAATNIRPINDLLEPFGLEIPLRKG